MNRTRKLEYKWVIVVISCFMVFTVLGFCSSANSMYITPITEALGISRGAYSVTTSVRYITTSVVNIFFGALIYRFGEKKLIIGGFVSLITSTFVYSIASDVAVFAIGSVFLGIGLSFTTTAMVGTVVNKWCAKNKGTIMGIALASNGVGAAVARVILTPIINSGDPFGYRDAYRLVILILAFAAIVMLLFFRNDPEGKVAEKIASEKKKINTQDEINVFKKPYFYVAMVSIFLTGLVLQSISGIADPHFKDKGVETALITTALSIHSIVLSLSKFTTGFLYDKAGLRVASSVCYGAAIIAMLSLGLVGHDTFGSFPAFVYSVLSSAALPLETIMLPIFARELFGENGFKRVLGVFVSVNTAGYAVGGPIANFIFDITGSYDSWIFISTAIIAIVFIAMNIVISASSADQKKEHELENTVAVQTQKTGNNSKNADMF